MYEIIKKINETTFIALKETDVFILKKIGFEDIEIYKKLTQIKNEFVVEIFETTVIDDDIFAVCEYVQGETLKKRVERNGVLSDDEVRVFSVQICEGLSQIHELGIVHRDITPGNIMITKSGTIKIIDFGISRIVKENVSNDTQVLGTFGYAAPEQFGFHQTHKEADIYAVGVIINFMKTGCIPNERLTEGRYRSIVEKCTEMDAEKRFDSAELLKAAVLKGYEKKKFTFANMFYSIPGFVRDSEIATVVSAVYYAMALFLMLAIEYKNYLSILGDYIPMFFMTFMPYFLIWNIGDWTGKLGFQNTQNKKAKIIIRVGAAFVSFVIGCIILALFSQTVE